MIKQNTDLHHCLMGECMNTASAKQAVMIEFEHKLIRREKLKIRMRSN